MAAPGHVDPLAAEIRAIEEGHRAFLNDDGSLSVKSDSRDGVTYRITFSIGGHFVGGEMAVKFSCSCPSGQSRPSEIVPCKHASLAGRRLEREGLAIWKGGIFVASPKARREYVKKVNAPDDPLEGLS